MDSLTSFSFFKDEYYSGCVVKPNKLDTISKFWWILWCDDHISHIALPFLEFYSNMLYWAEKYICEYVCVRCHGSTLKAGLGCHKETVPVVQCGWNPAPHIQYRPYISTTQHSNIELLHKTIIRIDCCFIFNKLSLSLALMRSNLGSLNADK